MLAMQAGVAVLEGRKRPAYLRAGAMITAALPSLLLRPPWVLGTFQRVVQRRAQGGGNGSGGSGAVVPFFGESLRGTLRLFAQLRGERTQSRRRHAQKHFHGRLRASTSPTILTGWKPVTQRMLKTEP